MDFDWNRCLICQQDTLEPLKCPLHNPVCHGKIEAYTSFLTNVEQFRDIGALPVEVYFGSDETADSFASHSASWHK